MEPFAPTVDTDVIFMEKYTKMGEEQQTKSLVAQQMADNAHVLQIRLDATQVMQDFEKYLTGKVRFLVDKGDGSVEYKTEQVSDPIANEKGIHWILNFLGGILNPQIVQGYFPEDKNGGSPTYDMYIDMVWESLYTNLAENLYEWGIHESNYNPIIDRMMAAIIPFCSRLIGNKERESYGASRLESQSVEKNKLKSHLPFTQ